jgi:hypothetical protein
MNRKSRRSGGNKPRTRPVVRQRGMHRPQVEAECATHSALRLLLAAEREGIEFVFSAYEPQAAVA